LHETIEIFNCSSVSYYLVFSSLNNPVAIRRVHGDNRIIPNQNVHSSYEYLARRELLRWLPAPYRTKDRVIQISGSLLTIWRRELMPGLPLVQRNLRYVILICSLLIEFPVLAKDRYFRHCIKEATGLLCLRNLLKGKGAVSIW